MKVTKLIREYVESRVYEVYQPFIESAEKAAGAAKDAMKADFLILRDVLTKEGERLAKKAGEDFMLFASAHGLPVSASSYRLNTDFFALSFVPYSSIAEELYAEAKALRDQRSAKVREILVSLELGATKADLERALSGVKVD